MQPPARVPELGQTITFPAWAGSRISALRKAVGIGSLLASAIAISYLEPTSWFEKLMSGELENLIAVKKVPRSKLAFVQAIVCLILAFMTPSAKPPAKLQGIDERTDIALQACRRINHLIKTIFGLWGAYYAITGFGLLGEDSLIDRPFLITLSSLTSLFIFWLYLEMGEITIATPSKGTEHQYAWAYHISGVVVFIFLVTLAWYGYARAAAGTKSYVKVLDIVDGAVALLSGVGLCFVVGRFADKLLNPGAVTLFFLYLYAVIQLGAAVISKEPLLHLTVTTIALPLKILLWLVCVWAFTTGILAEYVYEMRLLIEHVDAKRSRKLQPGRRLRRLKP